MSELSARLGLPFILPAQAQKHVTHNEALEQLDMLVQLSVEAFDAVSPPTLAEEGDVWALGADPVGEWAGQAGRLALWRAGGWEFTSPRRGWRAAHGRDLRLWDGSVWGRPDPGALQDLDGVGINASHDTANRLAVASEATLLTHDGAGHQLKINKNASTDTASLLFQTGWSGRAEMGLSGADDFSVKVSPDGSAWHEAIVVDRDTGRVRANGMRESLAADRIYFVRTDGDDANDGRTDDASGAFRSIQRALDTAFGRIDLGRFDVTIQVRPGVYEEVLTLDASHVGAGSVLLRGEASDPGAVVIRQTWETLAPAGQGGVLHVWNGAYLRVADLQVERAGGTGRPALDIRFGGHVLVEPGAELRVGAASTAAIRMLAGTFTCDQATLRHVGNAPRLIQANPGYANLNAATIDLDGRSYSVAVFDVNRAGALSNVSNALSITGSVSGPRVRIRNNGVIEFGNYPLSGIPGTSDGTIELGGVYTAGTHPTFLSGSNSNGAFLRFADGTQICTHRLDMGARTTFGAGTHANPYRSETANWTYPSGFVAPPAISATHEIDTDNASARHGSVVFRSRSASAVSAFQVGFMSNDTDADTVFVTVTAIGRWF